MAARKKPARKPAKKVVKPIPDGYHVLTPYLAIDGASAAIDFYKKVFGARVRLRMDAPGGKVGHAELQIGDSVIMLADEYPAMEFLGPRARGGTTVSLHMYVRNCDAVVAKAVAAGATLQRPLADQFYGDRNGTILDPFGHSWSIATHKEDLTPAQLRKRAAAMKGSG
jgi:PhnB protein